MGPRIRTSFSGQLRDRSRPLWDRMCGHPFVESLGDGSLSLRRFQHFMRQDYVFLIEYSRVLATAVARADDLDTMGRFAGLLRETLTSEMALHRSFCSDFGISERQLEATRPSRATLDYTRFLVKTATEGEIEDIAAVLLPCQWSYDEIGRLLEHSSRARPGSFHRRWIDGYASPEYRAVTAWLVGFVDQIGAAAGSRTKARMQRLFDESCRQEIAFWESAWRLGKD